MYSILIAIIYVAFISLGLPDSLLGSAWQLMYSELSADQAYAGIISMIISAGTIISSLFSDKLTRKLGAGIVTALSVMMTAVALLGFSLSSSFIQLCFVSIPYGLGAGAVDAALNNYVAIHYESKHMNWLHCFWGIGATIGPYIMGFAISSDHGWRTGYGIVSVIQIVLSLIICLSLPLWEKRNLTDKNSENYEKPLSLIDAVKIKGVPAILTAFFGYCAFESTAGLWASSYLVQHKGTDAETAAFFASMFYIGITLGRFASGFICNKIGDKNMIRIGVGFIFGGILLILIPTSRVICALVGLVIIGIGAAPVYPSIIHSTPEHFGKENSHAIVGIQMASAYCGSTFIPPVFGFISNYINISIYPFFIFIFIILLFIMTERVNIITRKNT